MGCGASTTVATDEIVQLLQQEKDSDINQMRKATADSGDLSVKDPHIFGDHLTLDKGITEDDTNFHNSPSNLLKDITSNDIDIPKNSTENDITSVQPLSVASSLSHNEEDTKSKKNSTPNDKNELNTKYNENSSEKSDINSRESVNQSKNSSHHSNYFKPTVASSDEEESTKIEIDEFTKSKQNDDIVTSERNLKQVSNKQSESSILLEQDQTSIHSNKRENNGKYQQESLLLKSYPAIDNVEHENIKTPTQKISPVNLGNEIYEKDSQSSHTLTASNKSPFFESINANADVNQNLNEDINNENAAMCTGDINQNHQLQTTIGKTNDYMNESLSVHEENLDELKKDILGTGDMCFAKVTPYLEDHYDNQLPSGFIIESSQNKDITSSRASQNSVMSKRSSISSSLRNEYLKTAEVHDDNLDESLHGFDIKDKIVDFSETRNEDDNLPESTNSIINFRSNKDVQEDQSEE